MKWEYIFSRCFFFIQSVCVLSMVQLAIEVLVSLFYGMLTDWGITVWSITVALLMSGVCSVFLSFLFAFFFFWKWIHQKFTKDLQHLNKLFALILSYAVPLLFSTLIAHQFIGTFRLGTGIDLQNSTIHSISLAILLIFNLMYGRIKSKLKEQSLLYGQYGQSKL